MNSDLDWENGARCADMPSAIFYAGKGNSILERDAALACCNGAGGCPVRRPCLAYSIARNEQAGTWGGMLADERADLARIRCPSCRVLVGRPIIAALVLEGHQHTRCTACGGWVEVIPTWDRPHRNSWITGTGRRT